MDRFNFETDLFFFSMILPPVSNPPVKNRFIDYLKKEIILTL